MKQFISCLIIVIISVYVSYAQDVKLRVDTVRLKNDLRKITKTENSRNYLNTETLNFVADYIFEELAKCCLQVYFQTFIVNETEYKNVIGSLGVDNSERIIIGAHYDVAGEGEGADDNASGVAGILELARLLSTDTLKYRIDFVAYTLEEPPFFSTENMGSYVHAKELFENNINVKGMICLDMIGYYDDEPKSQKYPLGIFRLFYGNKGNFISVIQKFNNGSFGRQFNRTMKKNKLINTIFFRGPSFIRGVDFSDHRNYWKFGYDAVFITNTGFYRNPNYHRITDKKETLDIERMALVIEQLYYTIKHISAK